jgi:cholest-4-en-3-one 26-monooxygenase
MSTVEHDPAALDCPVAWPRPGEDDAIGKPPFRDEQTGLWVISAYADIDRVFNDAKTFSSQFALGEQHATVFDPLKARAAEDQRIAAAGLYFRMAIEEGDGEVHKRERSFVGKAFTPKRVRLFLSMITELCEQLTEAMLDRSEVPFVQDFAVPLPAKIIAHGIGIPPERYLDFKRWSDGFQGPIGDNSPEKLEEFVNVAVEFTEFITPVIEERRRKPADDLISAMVGENERGERLSTGEILGMCKALMLGGNETTTMGLSGSMLYLVRVPEVQKQLRADPSLIPAFIEEGLRLGSPVQLLFRTATADTEVGGARIAKGEHVMLRMNAGSRDEARYDDPFVPHLDRRDGRHLAFGRGPHVCPGAPLARAELRIAFETLLARTSSITLADREDAVVAAGNPMTAAVGELYLDVRA